MDITEQLRILQEAQGDPTKLVLASIDIVYPALLESEREILKDALKAAAISHWCDEAILATLLEVPQSEAEILLDRLRNLNVVESFLARGANAVNVHEATRLALRKQMASDQQIFFRTLTTRAQAYFETDKSPAGQIEWIYHFLIADPNKGATACEALDRQWTYQSHPEDRYALALALKELETGEFLVGRARIEALLCIGETRSYRGETAQLESFAQEILVQAQRDNYAFGAARANSLLGNCFQAQGQLDEAKVAFDETLRISRQLAEQDPSNVVWQRSLAVAYSRTGDVLQAQGQLVEAKEAFDEYLRISRQLAEQDPSNAVWQRGLAVAYSKTGDVLQAQGLFVEARAVYDECLRIFRQLAEQDPSNANWQRDLAVAYSKTGDVLQAQGQLVEVKEAFDEYLRISRQLAEQDPSNAVWQRGLAVAYSKTGDVLQAQGLFVEARAVYDECLRIFRQLAEQDPSNAVWQRGLAVARSRVNGVLLALDPPP